MAISYGVSAGKEYWNLRGLSSDVKPTDDVPNGSTFEEIDTGNEFMFDKSAGIWYLQPASNGGGGVAGVSTFNNRSGAVMPLAGDYTAVMVGADPAGSAADALTDAKAYTDAELANYTVKTEFTQAVETVVETTVDAAVEEALQQNMSSASSDDINALFP